jgi:hypothetical protein
MGISLPDGMTVELDDEQERLSIRSRGGYIDAPLGKFVPLGAAGATHGDRHLARS